MDKKAQVYPIYPTLKESEFLAKAILSENRFVSFTARKIDINSAIIRYNIYFLHERINLLLDLLERQMQRKLHPLIQSPIIRALQKKIMKMVLLKEKVERLLNKKLPRKLRVTGITLIFCLSFGFLVLSSFTAFPKKYALTRLQGSHNRFRNLAFIGLEQDPYVKGLIILNTGLYFIQAGCLLGLFTPSTRLKQGLNSVTLGSTLALVSQAKLSDKITNSRFGPLVENIQRPQISLPLSTLFALGFYVSSQTMAASNGNIGTNQLFLNEVEIFDQIRKNILTLPNETKYKMEYLARKYYAEGLYPLSQMGCGSLRLNQSVPFDESKYLRCVHYVYRNYCLYTPACKEFGKEVLSVIETLVNKKNLSFGGASNLYNAPEIKAVSIINLFAYNKKPWETGFAEITENYQLYNWLRGVKFLMENSSDLNL